MAALQILVLSVQVRILVGQQKSPNLWGFFSCFQIFRRVRNIRRGVLSGFGEAACFAEVVGGGEAYLVGTVGGNEHVGSCDIGFAAEQDADNFVEIIAAEMGGTVDEDAETHNHLDFETCPDVVLVKTEGGIVDHCGHFERMSFEVGQFGHVGDDDGVGGGVAPAGEHLFEGAVGFDLYEEIVKLVAELFVGRIEGCGHIKPAREVEVDGKAVLGHVEGHEHHGVGDATVGFAALNGGDEFGGGGASDEGDVGKIVGVAQEDVAGAALDDGYTVAFQVFERSVSRDGGRQRLGSVVACPKEGQQSRTAKHNVADLGM